MKTKMLALLIAGLVSVASAHAASTVTVEFKGSFVKITSTALPVGAPLERDVPLLLYVRKSSILRVALIATAHSSNADFVVELVTSGPVIGSNYNDRGIALTDASKAYYYHFLNETNAVSFCESLLSDQNG